MAREGGGSDSAAAVDAWVHEHDADGEIYRRTMGRDDLAETLASGGLDVVGALLGFFLIGDIVLGILTVLPGRQWLIPYWLASIVLLGLGAWLAFHFASSDYRETEELAP